MIRAKTMLNYYRDGIEIDQTEAFQRAGEAMLCSGGDIEELNSIIWRMEEDEEAREIFESISRIEVMKRGE